MLCRVMECTTGVTYLLLVINDVRPLKDNSITSTVMCYQSLSGKWICTRVTKSVAKALSIPVDLRIYTTALEDGTHFWHNPSLDFHTYMQLFPGYRLNTKNLHYFTLFEWIKRYFISFVLFLVKFSGLSLFATIFLELQTTGTYYFLLQSA